MQKKIVVTIEESNSVEALIPFNKEHHGLLKLHVLLWWKWGRIH